MGQLAAIAENARKRKEAQDAAEGKPPVAPAKPKVDPAAAGIRAATAPKPSKPYVKPADLDDERAKELALRKKRAAEKQ